MPGVVDDLAAFINAANSSFTIGGKLSKGRMPDSPDEVVALIEILGFEPPTETFGASGSFSQIERPQIQVLSRGPKDDYETARTNSETVYKILRSVYESSTGINGTKYFMIQIRSSPHFQGEDDNSRYHISFTADCWKSPSS